MLTSFDRASANLTSQQIIEALQPLAASLGITITGGRGTYGASNFEMKVICAVKNGDGTPAGREADAFKQLAKLYGFRPDDLGRSFEYQGRTFRITGLSTRSKARPILAVDGQGRTFKFTHLSVVGALAIAGR